MRERLKMEIRGAVQGVGFRPFVYRLATGLGLSGWVLNDIRGVFLEVEGDPEHLSAFRKRLRVETPPRAQIQDLIESWLDPIGDEGFQIRTSEAKGTKTVLVLPDIATCQDCLAEILDPGDRRFRYPFANCTNCGPRFTIVRDLPYDRPNTTMRGFSLCPGCRAEYESPLDRRFHAQPTACPACGPQLASWTRSGEVLARGDEALVVAADVLLEGRGSRVQGPRRLPPDVRRAGRGCRREAPRPQGARRQALRPHGEGSRCRAVARARSLPRPQRSSSPPRRPSFCCPASPTGAVAPGGRAGAAGARAHAPRHAPPPPVAAGRRRSPCRHEREPERGAHLHRRARGTLAVCPVWPTPSSCTTGRSSGTPTTASCAFRPAQPRVLRRARGYAPLPVSVAEELPVILAVGAHMKNDGGARARRTGLPLPAHRRPRDARGDERLPSA